MNEKGSLIIKMTKDRNTDWRDHPYWEMIEEEQIEFEVYSDRVEMRELIYGGMVW